MEVLGQFIRENFGWFVGVVVVGLTTCIQELSKSFKPWTWLFRLIGRAINQDVLDGQEALGKRLDTLENRIDANDAEDAESKAKEARRRIVRCGDELRRKEPHSEEYFNDVLEDIRTYKQYCEDHKAFKNEKAVISIRVIEQEYERCLKEDGFL